MPSRDSKTKPRRGTGPVASARPRGDGTGGPSAGDGDKLETLFQTLVKNVFGVITVTAPDGTVQYATPSVKRVLGYDPNELFGEKVYKYFYPDDAKAVRRAARTVSASGTSSEPFDARARHWDGSFRICQIVIQKLPGGLAFSYHDVTDQRKAEEALRRSEERYRKAFRNSPDSITISEMATGRLIEVNEGFERMSGYNHDEVIGKTSLELGIWKDAATREGVVKRLKRDGAVRDQEVDFVNRDGEVLHCLISLEPIELDKKRCLLLVARDITERKIYEEKLERTSAALERERQELTEKNIALKQVLDHIEQEKAAFRKETSTRIETVLTPVIEKLKSEGGKLSRKDIAQLESGIDSVVGEDVDSYRENLKRLTPRELDICDLIKEGCSSKEIAERLNVSVQTVHKHRQLIRRKLQITNQDVNLAAYLRLR